MAEVLAIVLGGGRGERLYPLTRERAKPAIPFGAKYRLIDIALSNCINSDFRQIYILTQFNSVSLNSHISRTYTFDAFGRGFVEILAAEQTYEHSDWYQGTADAVRQNLQHFNTRNPSHYLILAGDQLFKMDLRDFFRRHCDSGADISVAVTPVAKSHVHRFGILRVDETGRIVAFVEKPDRSADTSALEMPSQVQQSLDLQGKEYLASMGIYLFNADVLKQLLAGNHTDFGSELLPAAIETQQVQSYIFGGYWEDVGTIKSYFQTGINLTSITPNFNFYDEKNPIYTHRRDLPACKINRAVISQSVTADGCIITHSELNQSLVGIRTIIEGSRLDRVICLGADYYETWDQKEQNRKQGIPDLGIGPDCQIRDAIIDKNTRIGRGCRIGVGDSDRRDGEYQYHTIRDGIIIISKNAVIPPHSVL